MLRLMMRTSWLIALVLGASFAAAQAEFSAEIVNTTKAGNPVQAKIYIAKDKMRFESAEREPGAMTGAFIVNLATQTSTVLMNQQHMYMEMPAQAANVRNTYNLFHIGDVGNACPDWLAQARNKGGTCHKVGSDTVNGRSAVKYEGTNAAGDSATVWIDPKLRFPLKWQDKNGSGELRNIQEGSQPASLFEIPAGYTKFDVGAMMKQRPQ